MNSIPNNKASELTSNPTVYGIISQSPLFKVAFPLAQVVTIGSSYDKDNGKESQPTSAVKEPANIPKPQTQIIPA